MNKSATISLISAVSIGLLLAMGEFHSAYVAPFAALDALLFITFLKELS